MPVTLHVISGTGGRVAKGASEQEMALRLYRGVMLVCIALIFFNLA